MPYLTALVRPHSEVNVAPEFRGTRRRVVGADICSRTCEIRLRHSIWSWDDHPGRIQCINVESRDASGPDSALLRGRRRGDRAVCPLPAIAL